MPRKKRKSPEVQNWQGPNKYNLKLSTGNWWDGAKGFATPTATPYSPSCQATPTDPAFGNGDSLGISWKTFLSTLRSMDERLEIKIYVYVKTEPYIES